MGEMLFPSSLLLVFPSGMCNCLEEPAQGVTVLVSLHPLQCWNSSTIKYSEVKACLALLLNPLTCLGTFVSLTA